MQVVLVCLLCLAVAAHAAERELIVSTNTVVRVMAANITGNSQKYEAYSLRILKGLQPDVVAIQEFNYLNNSPADFRQMIDATFGTNFSYFRESGYSIPNGVISRYPIRASGSWDDTEIPDRGFAWAQLDIPGTNDLFVVSVHLKSSSSDADVRSREATALKQLITANFPTNAWIVLAGDMNLQNRTEAALVTLKTFLSDEAIPTDSEVGGNPNTNEPRSRPYDVVLPSFDFATNLTPVVIGPRTFTNGLVFDSRVFTPLSAVTPAQFGDSGQAQHMAVMKDFQINFAVTNRVEVPAPLLVWQSNSFVWDAVGGVEYTVELSTNLESWINVAQFTATTTNAVFTNAVASNAARFYRVSF